MLAAYFSRNQRAFVFLWDISTLFSYSSREMNNYFFFHSILYFFFLVSVPGLFNQLVIVRIYMYQIFLGSLCFWQLTITSCSETCGIDLILSGRSCHWKISRSMLVCLHDIMPHLWTKRWILVLGHDLVLNILISLLDWSSRELANYWWIFASYYLHNFKGLVVAEDDPVVKEEYKNQITVSNGRQY